MRLVDADAIPYNYTNERGVPMTREIDIQNMPTIEPERKTGEWIHDCVITEYSATGRFNLRSCECSECGANCEQESNFCPNCGSQMEREGEQNG